MRVELDHLFVCSEPGAPEAERLIELGFCEGPANQHPGQGTANRRFFFANAMLELLWVSDAQEAQSERTRRTRLWERWSRRQDGGASPFGVCVRPADLQSIAPPFPAWEYRLVYLRSPLVMHIGEAGVEEPMWIYADFQRRAPCEARFTTHPGGMREITGLTLTSPLPLRSAAAEALVQQGVLSIRQGAEHLLEVEFDGQRKKQAVDCRPHLPLVFRL
jgi:hypothetical protein